MLSESIEKPVIVKTKALRPIVETKGNDTGNITQPWNPTYKKHFTFLKNRKNPDYEKALVRLPFESCLLHNKSDKIYPREIHIQTQPKWETDLLKWGLDEETGELLPTDIYTTNSFKASNGRKIKALDKFCNYYQPLYQKREVSLFFFTFTKANNALRIWKDMNEIINKYLKRKGYNVRGQVWTAEVSEKLHWHYHLCVATDRVNVRGLKLSKVFHFNKLWGQRTKVTFVKKNIKNYMAKYFAKDNFRVLGFRSYGISQNLK